MKQSSGGQESEWISLLTSLMVPYSRDNLCAMWILCQVSQLNRVSNQEINNFHLSHHQKDVKLSLRLSISQCHQLIWRRAELGLRISSIWLLCRCVKFRFCNRICVKQPISLKLDLPRLVRHFPWKDSVTYKTRLHRALQLLDEPVHSLDR